MNEKKLIRILIADDESHVRNLLRDMLTEAGYQVVGEAANGVEAFEKTCSLRPDVVLMDIHMPEMNGIEAAKRIQKKCPTPVVMVTGLDDIKYAEEASEAGVCAFLKKPLELSKNLEHAIIISIARFNDIMELRRLNQELKKEIAVRTHAEKLIIQAKTDWEKTFNAVTDMILLIDTRFQIFQLNKAASDRLRLPISDCIGKTCFSLIHHQDQPSEYCPHRQGLLGKIQSYECHETHLGGDFMATSSPLADNTGNISGAVLVFRDITHLKKIQRELNFEKDKAENANRAKTEFLANMSHEIRTPLNAIVGMSSLISETPLNSEQREYAQAIKVSSKSLLSLVDDILDFSKIEAGKIELAAADFNLIQVIETVINIITIKSNEKGLIVGYKIDKEVPLQLIGDAGRLRQILLNLAGNAVKFTEKGFVSIQVSLDSRTQRQVTLRFLVADSGIGIPKDKEYRLFKPFSQINGSITRRYTGTGLGLAISKQLAEMMGGQIGFESTVGVGSTFWFTAVFEKSQTEVDLFALSANSITSSISVKNSTIKILLVEDNPFNQKVAKSILKKYGFTLDTANNGIEAIQALKTKVYDLVMMDIQMPEMDGLEATRAIRAGSPPVLNPNIPIIALTAHSSKEDKEACLQAGMNGYITKPFDQTKLVNMIIKLISE